MGAAERFIAVDVGNSRVKLGLFEPTGDCERAALSALLPIAGRALPEPIDTFDLPGWSSGLADGPGISDALREWVLNCPVESAFVGSVHRQAGEAMIQSLGELGVRSVRPLVGSQLPIEVRVDEPERVGVDRLLAAVAANRLRREGTPAIVVDIGTAITIDLVAPDGAFEGGAILPGIHMAARALHDQTDALPMLEVGQLDESPDAVGKTTEAALRAGLYWGAVGAIREVIARQRDRLTTPPQLFLTGGAAPSVARLLSEPDCSVRYLPHLVLAGVAIAAESLPDAS